MAVQVQQLQRRLFTVDEYHAMAKAGILTEDDRIELLCGEIVDMAPIGSRHAACVKGLIQLFVSNLSQRALIGAQDPILLSEHSEPQPDISVLQPREDRYASGHPTPADIYLLIEVADTTAAYDREVKAPLYAQAGIPEVWLVDLTEARVEVYREPSPQGYRHVRYAYAGDTLTPAAFEDVTLAVDAMLG